MRMVSFIAGLIAASLLGSLAVYEIVHAPWGTYLGHAIGALMFISWWFYPRRA
jgi:hypothetical protein